MVTNFIVTMNTNTLYLGLPAQMVSLYRAVNIDYVMGVDNIIGIHYIISLKISEGKYNINQNIGLVDSK